MPEEICEDCERPISECFCEDPEECEECGEFIEDCECDES